MTRIAKPCMVPTCSAVTLDRFCPDHRRAQRKRYEATRPSSTARGYGPRWRQIRKLALLRNPYCDCGQTATEVDHVVSLKLGGSYDESNLKTYCKPCHSRKTALYDGGFGRR